MGTSLASPTIATHHFTTLVVGKGDEMSRTDLKETADQAGDQTTFMESVKGWMMFFGILTIISLLLKRAELPHAPSRSWAIIIDKATT